MVFNNEKESENDGVMIGETRRLQVLSSIFPRMYGCVSNQLYFLPSYIAPDTAQHNESKNVLDLGGQRDRWGEEAGVPREAMMKWKWTKTHQNKDTVDLSLSQVRSQSACRVLEMCC